MPSSGSRVPSPPPASDVEQQLVFYKSQCDLLEAELADFQASSRELETELERDVEASEKRERKLQEKVEGLGYEVEEWKTKYKQSKAEANSAQNNLQKEITSLRETNRTIQLRLRDIEVANDDIERQARNTNSSLEDLESKYNMAIERDVMMEEEIKNGEQERENLRIEAQRLREELSDLRVEAEVRQTQLRNVEAAAQRQRSTKVVPRDTDLARPSSPASQHSRTTSTSSPTIPTPPTKSASSTVSDAPTPPSPPNSDHSIPNADTTTSKPLPKSRLSMLDSNVTPRPSTTTTRTPGHIRNPSISRSNQPTPYVSRRSTIHRPSGSHAGAGLPASESLHHIRGLIGKMQKLEQRVNSARSKLPAPTSTPPRASPRSSSALGQTFIPPTITMRSSKRRTGGSNASAAFQQTPDPPQRPQSRLSFGIPQPSPSRQANTFASRPGSRASLSSRQSISNLPSAAMASSISRPGSRQSTVGDGTSLSQYSTSTMSESRRPRSSIGGSYATTHHSHSHSASVSRLSNYGSQTYDDEGEDAEVVTPTPARRGTFGKPDQNSAIPSLPASTARRRTSGLGHGRRISSGTGNQPREESDMGPPGRKMVRKLSGVGETF
ncbi:MAG: hypothetical protein Q9195_009112 [Heterodermia aff. obscurata]